ncbi:Histidinol-phosphate aminotransferase [Metalysinibacillus saudimassiliensis]|uniref:Histidinol-phosphate aminotransferase n=1 Tax=Metalysinibacillus saudimassiliensis TaxID=1461583 RepID=A0A078MBN4_9BACL|nr:Histidinol-phosphate aminotransferase [Metalysinibacillus saudimassiliensis]
MKWKQQIHNMKAYQPGKPIEAVKEMYNLQEVVKLASNENPFGCSPKINEFLQQAAVNHAIYPDGYAQSLRTVMAQHLQVSENELIFGNGSDDLIAMITRSLLYPGVNTVMADLTFSQYWHNADIEGAEVRKVPVVDGAHDLPKMLEAIDDNTSVVWLCSPNNPTGVVIADDELRAFLAQVPKDVLVVLDEAYFEYVVDERHKNTLPLIHEFPNVIILRTFSKAYGLAGFRVGYGIAHQSIIAKIDPVRAPFNNTVLSHEIAKIAVADQQFIKACVAANERGKRQFEAFCDKHGLHYYPSATNFVLFEIKTDSDVVFEKLMQRGFIVRSGRALGAPGYLRVTIGTEEQNNAFFEQLEAVLQEQGVFI